MMNYDRSNFMNPKEFESLGQHILNIKLLNGFQVGYKDCDVDISLSSNLFLNNPSFSGKFSLPPGSIQISLANDKKVDLILEPDISAHSALLKIYPLNKGQFEFKITQKIHKIPLTFWFNSVNSHYSFLLTPSFSHGPLNFNGTAEYDGSNITTSLSAYNSLFASYIQYLNESKTINFNIFSHRSIFNFGISTILSPLKPSLDDFKLYLSSNLKKFQSNIILKVYPKKVIETRIMTTKHFNSLIQVANYFSYEEEKGISNKNGVSINLKGHTFGLTLTNELQMNAFYTPPKYLGSSFRFTASCEHLSLNKEIAQPTLGIAFSFEKQ